MLIMKSETYAVVGFMVFDDSKFREENGRILWSNGENTAITGEIHQVCDFLGENMGER